MKHLVSDAKSNNTDAHPSDCSNLSIQRVCVNCRYAICDQHDNTIGVLSLIVIATEHLYPCQLETAGHVRRLSEISYSVDGF